MIVLQIFGVIFLLILLIVGFFGFRIWRGLRKLKGGSDDFVRLLSVLPPINFELESMDSSQWLHPRELRENSALLTKLGFEDEGLHLCFIGEVEAHMAIWWHPSKHLTVVVYEIINHNDESADPFLYYDMLINTTDRVIAVSTNTVPNLFPDNPKFQAIKSEAKDLKQLLASFKSALPDGIKLKPISSGKEFYLESTLRYNRWLWQKPQLTSPEMHNVYGQMGIDLTDELLDTLLDHAAEEASMQLNDHLISVFTQRSKISAAQWEQIRDRLVIVHNEMTNADFYQSLYQLFSYEQLEPHEDEIETLQEAKLSQAPTRALEDLCQSLNLKLPKRIARLSNPVEAHFYLGELT